jgi:hypothetical protein
VSKVSVKLWLAEAWRFTLHPDGTACGRRALHADGDPAAFRQQALLAYHIGTAAGALTRFVLSYLHVFEPTKGAKVALGRFLVVLGVQTCRERRDVFGFVASVSRPGQRK